MSLWMWIGIAVYAVVAFITARRTGSYCGWHDPSGNRHKEVDLGDAVATFSLGLVFAPVVWIFCSAAWISTTKPYWLIWLIAPPPKEKKREVIEDKISKLEKELLDL